MHDFWCKKGHFNEDQASFFKELIQKYDPCYVIETGFCTGRSASSILVNAKNIKKMISIDINFDYIKPEGRIYRKKLEDGFKVFSTIEADSVKVLNPVFFNNEFPHGVDWVTVDGSHTYEGCMSDLVSVADHININGLIVVDDYKSGPPNGSVLPEVTRACDDFFKKDKTFEKKEWNCKGKGFCILRKL